MRNSICSGPGIAVILWKTTGSGVSASSWTGRRGDRKCGNDTGAPHGMRARGHTIRKRQDRANRAAPRIVPDVLFPIRSHV